jgi:hypothetical protein
MSFEISALQLNLQCYHMTPRVEMCVALFCLTCSHNMGCKIYSSSIPGDNRLCGLVVRVLGYRSGGPGSIPGTTRKKM